MERRKVVYLGTAESMRRHDCVVLEDGTRPLLIHSIDDIRGLRDVEVLFCYSWRNLPISRRVGVIDQLRFIVGVSSWTDVCEDVHQA